MATAHTEAVLAIPCDNEVKDLLGYFKKLEADLPVTKNVNSKLIEMVVQTERKCWANAQYSRRDTIEVIGISLPIRKTGCGRRSEQYFWRNRRKY